MLNEVVQRLINKAIYYEGYLEKSSDSQLDDFTANAGSNNFTRFARDYKAYTGRNYQGCAWCAMYVSDMFVETFGLEYACKLLCGDLFQYTPTGAGQFKKAKRWVATPQVGDVIFFKNSVRICHVGIVYAVDESRVYTIEGNTSAVAGMVANGGCVRKKSYALTYANIAGYGRPDYSIVSVASLASAQEKLKQALKIAPGNATLEDAQQELKKALKIFVETPNVSGKYNKTENYNTTLPTGILLKRGSSGINVGILQTALNKLINAGLTADCDFGGATDRMVRAFQKKHGLIVDGEVGKNTIAKINSLLTSGNTITEMPGTVVNTSPAKNQNIQDLQHALNADGFRDSDGNMLVEDGVWGAKTASAAAKVLISKKTCGKYINVTAWVQCRIGANPDGLFGSKTKACVTTYQSSKGLSADGVVGKNTMLQLIRDYM